MADLDPLIRYRKHIVDEKKRVLAKLYEETQALEAEKEKTAEEIARERALARESGDPQTLSFLGQYVAAAGRKIEKLQDGIKALELRIAIAQEDMRGAFAELKKVEIVSRNRDKAAAKEDKRKEDMAFDEIALDGFRRRQDEES